MPMIKAISIKQPWANMIREGEKTVETRAWSTLYRGPLLICSSKRPNLPEMLSGFALAICDLVDCRLMVGADEEAACCQLYPGAYAFVLANVRTTPPFALRGQMRLFDVTLPPGFFEVVEDAQAPS